MAQQKNDKNCIFGCVLPVIGAIMKFIIVSGTGCIALAGCGRQEYNTENVKAVNTANNSIIDAVINARVDTEDFMLHSLEGSIVYDAEDTEENTADSFNSEPLSDDCKGKQTKLNYDSVDFVLHDEGHVYSGRSLYLPCAVRNFTDNIDVEWDIFGNLVDPMDTVNVQFEGGETNLYTMAVNPDESDKMSVEECVITCADIYIQDNVTLELFDGEVIVTNTTPISEIVEVLGTPTESYYLTEIRVYTYDFNCGYIDFIVNADGVVYYVMITSMKEEYVDGDLAEAFRLLLDQ